MASKDQTDPKNQPAADESSRKGRKDPAAGPPPETNPRAGMEHEVGDLDDPDAVEDEGALPGRMGGGLAGG